MLARGARRRPAVLIDRDGAPLYPAGVSFESAYLFVVLAAALVLFYTQWLRADLTAFLVLVATIFPWRSGPHGPMGILTPEEGLGGFGSPAVVMVGCMFVVGAAMVRTGAAQLMGGRLLGACAHNELLLQTAILVATTLFSSIVNDTTVVLVWMPVVTAICRERRLSPSRYLLCVAYGSLLGGMWTLIGTRSNIIVSSFLSQHSPDGIGLGFFEFTPIAVVIFLLALLYFLLVGRRFLPAARTDSGLADDYHVKEYLTEVMVTPHSSIVGRTLGELDIADRYSVAILSIIRGDEKMPAENWMRLERGDVFVVQGEISKIAELLHSPDFKFKEELTVGERTLRSVDLVMVEAIVAPHSTLVGRSLEEIHFSREYGLTVMGISRLGRPIVGRPTAVHLQFGDALLLVGHPQGVDRLRGKPDFMLLEQQPFPIVGKRLALMTLGIMALTVTAIVLGLVTPAVGMPLAAALLVLLGCVNLRDAYGAIDWGALIVVGGMIPFGLALEKTGTAEILAAGAVDSLRGFGPTVVLGGFLLFAVLLTQLIENAAAAIVLSPIGFAMAGQLDASPRPFLLGLALVVSAAFMTPIAHESTILVMGPGRYRFRDYLMVGSGLAVITWLTATILVPVFRPFGP